MIYVEEELKRGKSGLYIQEKALICFRKPLDNNELVIGTANILDIMILLNE